MKKYWEFFRRKMQGIRSRRHLLPGWLECWTNAVADIKCAKNKSTWCLRNEYMRKFSTFAHDRTGELDFFFTFSWIEYPISSFYLLFDSTTICLTSANNILSCNRLNATLWIPWSASLRTWSNDTILLQANLDAFHSVTTAHNHYIEWIVLRHYTWMVCLLHIDTIYFYFQSQQQFERANKTSICKQYQMWLFSLTQPVLVSRNVYFSLCQKFNKEIVLMLFCE